MEHVKKMVVVPQEVIARLTSNETQKRSGSDSLDAEMHRILNDKLLNDNEKWKQYQQVLQRYLHFAATKRRDISLPIVEEREKVNDGGAFDRAHRESTALIDELVDTFPKIYKNEARNLLRFMNRGPVTWNARGVVSVNGEEIPGSNIVDILHTVVRARKTSRLPTGWAEVMSSLKESNVPKEYVYSPAALQYLGERGDNSSSPTPLLRTTPIRDRLRPRLNRPVSPGPNARRQILGNADEDNDEHELSFDRWESLPY